MRLGVIGLARDPHCQRLLAVIEQRGLEAVLVDTSAFPEAHRFAIGAGGCTYDGDPLDDVPVFFLRAVMSPIPHVYVQNGEMHLYDDWHAQYMRAREKHGFLLSWLLGQMQRGKWILNAPQFALIGQLKPFHTDALIRAGLPLPPTLMTSDPDEARAFIRTHEQVVYKPVMGADSCRMVNQEVWDRLDAIRHSPTIFQAFVKGEAIRVTLTRERILSVVRIPSETVDFRDAEGYREGATRYETVTLPSEIEQMCLRAIQVSGYHYTAIDLVRSFPHGYWLLECNYAPAYAAIEEQTGHAISEGLVDYMLQMAERPEPELNPYPPGLFDYRMA